MNPAFGVWIEGHGLQSYIFEVPRLRTMIGANSMLGRLWFHDLPQLLRKEKNAPQPRWNPLCPSEDKLSQLSHNIGSNKGDDLLQEDDPFAFLAEGIVNYSGGHFLALFTTADGAAAFLKAAVALIQETVPGLSATYQVFEVDLTDYCNTERKRRSEQKHSQLDNSQTQVKAEPPHVWNPWAESCKWSGLESGIFVEDGKPAPTDIMGKKEPIGPIALQKWRRGRAFDRSTNSAKKDPLHIMLKRFKKEEQLSEAFDKDEAIQFADLTARKSPHDVDPYGDKSRGNLAIIKIDGNQYGQRFREVRERLGNPDYFSGALEVEIFWRQARRLMRKALLAGLSGCLKDRNLTQTFTHFPARVLMLGGDDLLLVCAAELAFDFLFHFEEAFQSLQGGKENQLTFSAGLLFMPVTYPFHAGHELAEELIASAKAFGRDGNHVDWHILKTGHTQNLDQIRNRNYVRSFGFGNETETLLLTRRPYAIASKNDHEPNLKTLWAKTQTLVKAQNKDFSQLENTASNEDKVGRKLNQMKVSLGNGRQLSEFDFVDFGLNKGNESPLKELWYPLNKPTTHYATDLMDILEMADIAAAIGSRNGTGSSMEVNV